MIELDGRYLSNTDYALPIKVQDPPDGPINIYVGTHLVGKMIHAEAAPDGSPGHYWLADDEGNQTTHFLETRFEVAVAELLMAKGYIDHVGAYLMFDKWHDKILGQKEQPPAPPPIPDEYMTLPDRDPEIEPSGVKPGLIGFAIGIAIAILIFMVRGIFL